MSDADDDTFLCERHGPARAAFVCHHLVGGSGLGFWHSDNGPYPDAWCDACDAVMMRTGRWTAKAQKFADIRIVCHRCYVNIRRRNRVRKGRGRRAT
jgi:hypothetical protein